MTDKKFSKISQPDAQLLCQAIELDEADQSLLTAEIGTVAYLHSLIAQQRYQSAIAVLAHALPKREAIWWACLATRKRLNDKSTALDLQALTLAEAWVYKPNEQNRLALIPIIRQLNSKSPSIWAAYAAFWSSTNISFNNEVVVNATDDTLTAKAVYAALLGAAVNDPPEHIAQNYQLFLQQGIDIACGGDGRLTKAVEKNHD